MAHNYGSVDMSTHHAAPPPIRDPISSSLPADPHTFVGRDRELRWILNAADRAWIISVDGMAGVGKTTFALRAAHALAPRFPDGQYFVELHGHTLGQAAAASDVLGELLIESGMDPRNIPDTLTGRRDEWRNRLASKRVLLVLDDAADQNQIEPLLPSGPGCLTLITSRRRMVGLDDTVTLPLTTLEPAAAAELFRVVSGRIDAEAADLAQIIGVCGYLPLAIVLLAGRLAHHPSWTLTWLVAQFDATRNRLVEFEAGRRTVLAAFTMSYDALAPPQQRLFRRLGLHPGAEYEFYAAAALDDQPLPVTRRRLDALYLDHLIDEPTAGRYRMHDLLREFAQSLADADSAEVNSTARHRLLDYYCCAALAADRYLACKTRPRGPSIVVAPIAVPPMRSRDDAMTWMRTERDNLLDCLDYAQQAGEWARLVELTEAMAGFIQLDGPLPLAIALHERAVAGAQEIGDDLGAANALDHLGWVRYLTDDYPRATEALARAQTLYQRIGSRQGEANTVGDLGRVRYAKGDHLAAIEVLERALADFRAIADRLGEANTLDDLSLPWAAIGNHAQAGQVLDQALSVYCDLGNLLGQANALNHLGQIHCQTGDYARAAAALRQAFDIYQRVGDRLGQANALRSLGQVLCATGDYRAAAAAFRSALAWYQEIGSPLGRARALAGIAHCVFWDTDADRTEAIALLQDAVTIYTRLGATETASAAAELAAMRAAPDC